MRRPLLVGAVVLAVLAVLGGVVATGVWWLAGNDLPGPFAAAGPTADPTARSASPQQPGRATAPAPSASGVPQDRPGPVLLVPGYGAATGLLQPLAARLRADGRTTVIVDLPDGGTGEITDQARTLDVAVRRQLRAGAPSVDVIGFSAGGVVARVWARDLGGARVARRIVTLGSPHHGTGIAGIASALLPGECPQACRELAPGSPLLSGLGPAPDGPVWTSIWTAHDDLVVPASSAELDGALGIRLQDVCADDASRHAELPGDPLVQALVRAALARAPLLARPPASRCATLRAG